MKTRTTDFLKQKMSLDELQIQEPGADLVAAARAKVLERKKEVVVPQRHWFFNFFKFEINVYHAGFAALLITVGVLYMSRQKYGGNTMYGEGKTPQNTSINSSTVLASLTQYTLNKPSVNSSTVLTSIITFVAKN